MAANSTNPTNPVPYYSEGLFPVLGIDVSCEYGRQPSLTTPAGVNVRSYEPSSNRVRGGSREGLTRFIDEQVSGNFEIQHLTTIVTTSPVNLIAATTIPSDLGEFYLTDPSTGTRNPDRVVPFGGDGVMPDPVLTNNPDDGFDEDKLQIGTVAAGGFVTIAIDGHSVTASPIRSTVPPIGTKVVVVPVGGGVWKYDSPLWM